jgi:hypothetical protein
MSACTPESEPFTYPEEDVTEPTTVTHMVRSISNGEDWEGENSEVGCKDDLSTINFALYDLTYSRGYATLHLKPDTATCDLYAALSTSFDQEEIASDYWKNWKMEFTFSELRLAPEAEVRMNLRYRNIAVDLDIAPHLRQILELDTSTVDAEGTLTLNIDEDFSEFQLNGIVFNPNFSDESGNSFDRNVPQSDPGFTLGVRATGIEDQTLMVFNFLRVTSFGIPEE